MPQINKDMVRESSDTTGTGNIHLTGAYTNHRTFASVMADGDTCFARVLSTTANLFEIGKYTRVDATHLSRTTILDGSNGTSAVNFTSGPLDIALVSPAHLYDLLGGLQAASIASAATTDIWNIDGNSAHVTGTTGITGFGTAARAGLLRVVAFDGALTITGGSNLVLPNGVSSLAVEAGSWALVYADTTSKAIVLEYVAASPAAARGLIFAPSASLTPGGRLTLQSGAPVMSATQASKTTLYYTPYNGNQIPIYDGTNMVPSSFSELSVATTDTAKSPAAIGVSKVNDWFAWNDGGTIRLSHGPDWTSDTARSAGTALVMVNGILLNNAGITNGPAAQRGTYVGTTRSDSSSQLSYILAGAGAGGSAGLIGVWNAYNRVAVKMNSQDTTSSWTYSTATARASNNSNSNRIYFVSGLAEDGVDFHVYQDISTAASASAFALMGVALDATNALDRYAIQLTPSTAAARNTIGLMGAYAPQLGFHYIQATEKGDGSTTTTFTGGSGGQGLIVEVKA